METHRACNSVCVLQPEVPRSMLALTSWVYYRGTGGLLWVKGRGKGPHFLSISLVLPGLDEVQCSQMPQGSKFSLVGVRTQRGGGAVLRMATRVGLPPTEAMSTPELIPGGPGCVLTSPALRVGQGARFGYFAGRSGTTALPEEGKERGGAWVSAGPAWWPRAPGPCHLPACAQTFCTCPPRG